MPHQDPFPQVNTDRLVAEPVSTGVDTQAPRERDVFPEVTEEEGGGILGFLGGTRNLTDPPNLTEEEADILSGFLEETGDLPQVQESSNLPWFGQFRSDLDQVRLSPVRPDEGVLAHELGHEVHRAVGPERTREIVDSVSAEASERPVSRDVPEPGVDTAPGTEEREELAMAIDPALRRRFLGGEPETARDSARDVLVNALLEERARDEMGGLLGIVQDQRQGRILQQIDEQVR